MQHLVISVAMLSIGYLPNVVAAQMNSDSGGSVREAAERLAFECLSGDRRIECLSDKGFRCATVGEPSRKTFSCYISLEDGCYRMRFQLKEDGWINSDTWLTGECVDSHEPILEPGVRWKYDNTNSPDELVFRLFVQLIFAETLDYIDDLDALDGEPNHAGYYFVEAGLTGKMGSADVVRYFASRYLDIEREVEELSKKLLCDDDQPRYAGAENFFVFNQLDDVALHVYEHHLLLARADLQAKGLFDLDKALHEFPAGFTSVSTERDAARDGSIPRIYEAASRLCKEPWGQSFMTSGSSTKN